MFIGPNTRFVRHNLKTGSRQHHGLDFETRFGVPPGRRSNEGKLGAAGTASENNNKTTTTRRKDESQRLEVHRSGLVFYLDLKSPLVLHRDICTFTKDWSHLLLSKILQNVS